MMAKKNPWPSFPQSGFEECPVYWVLALESTQQITGATALPTADLFQLAYGMSRVSWKAKTLIQKLGSVTSTMRAAASCSSEK